MLTFASIIQQQQDPQASWACSLGEATQGFGNIPVWLKFLRRELDWFTNDPQQGLQEEGKGCH